MSRSLACLVPLGALAAAPAAAEVTWTVAPTNVEMAAVYPQKAKAAGIGGGVELACTSTRTGDMTDCDVLAEEPRGYGFGIAARKLAHKMQAAGMRKDVEVRISMTFAPELAKGGPVTVKTPKWAAFPSASEMQGMIPKHTDGPNEARVTLVCDVAAGGVLSGCVVAREEPAGEGFGAYVLSLAPKFRTTLMSAEGMPTVGAKVRLPVRFSLKPEEQATR